MKNHHSNHLLEISIKDQNWSEVDKLLTKNVDKDYIDEEGRTFLQLATEKNAPNSIIASFISRCNINNGDYDCQTPVFTGVKNERWDIVKLLSKQKAAVDHKFSYGYFSNEIHYRGSRDYTDETDETEMAIYNPLAYALERNVPLDILALLISKANINAQTCDHSQHVFTETSLHIALRKRNLLATSVLLDHGADCNACDGDENTPSLTFLNLPVWEFTSDSNAHMILMDRLVPTDCSRMYTTAMCFISGAHFRNQYKQILPYFMCLFRHLKKLDITSLDVSPRNRLATCNGLYDYQEPSEDEEDLVFFSISLNCCTLDMMKEQNVELVMAFSRTTGQTYC
jgi:ankyrin repeat protein